MHFKRFQQGDSVQYAGDKEHLAKELNGMEGTVVGRVQNSEVGVVVDFGGDAYIMDETRHLARFVKRQKPEAEAQKGPEVQKRRGVSDQGGKGKKRRNQEED